MILQRVPKTILVYSHGELLGDGMVRLPFVQQLRQTFPDSHITWMACSRTTAYASILKPIVEKDLNEVYELTKVGSQWRQWFKPPWAEEYDLVVDLQTRVKNSLVIKRLAHQYFLSSMMNWRFSDLKPLKSSQKPEHFAREALQYLELLTGIPHGLEYKVSVPASYLEEAQKWRSHFLKDKKNWVLLAPGSGGRHKCWPLESFTNLSKELQNCGCVVSYILGPQDLEYLEPIKAIDSAATFPLQEWSDQSIYTTLALANAADVCVANDAGVGHVFAATKTNLVSLFGPIEPEAWRPLTPNLTVLKTQDFAPTVDMNAIPVKAVKEAVMARVKA